MKVTAYPTEKVTGRSNIFHIFDNALTHVPERSIVIVTSKVVALCEGAAVPIGASQKTELIEREAEYYLDPSNKYNISLTIKNGILIPSAGIDESNADGHYVLWPRNPQQSANEIREYLEKRFGLKEVGVIITDSKTTPLRWGTTGMAIVHSGFQALKNYIGKPDLFGRIMKITKANIMDGLAAAAVVVMGEGDEQTPLVLIEDVPLCQFDRRNPTEEELKALRIELDDDLYAPMLSAVNWKKGGKLY